MRKGYQIAAVSGRYFWHGTITMAEKSITHMTCAQNIAASSLSEAIYSTTQEGNMLHEL
jgi:hypothetical protein